MQGLNFHLLPLESPTFWQISTVNSEKGLALQQPGTRVWHAPSIPSSLSCSSRTAIQVPVCSFNCLPPQFINFTYWEISMSGRLERAVDPSVLLIGASCSRHTVPWLRRDCSTALPKKKWAGGHMRQGALQDFLTQRTKAVNPYNHPRLLALPGLTNNYLKIMFLITLATLNTTSYHLNPSIMLSPLFSL